MANLPQKPLDNQGQFVTVFHGEINQNTEMLCNARDLHKFLNVGRKFNTWIKDRIKQYGFVKNQDFVLITQNGGAKTCQNGRTNTFSQTGEKVKMGRPTVDYHITLDMAKELAMIENNEQGRKVRRYFIECEKQVLQSAQSITAQITQTSLTLEHVNGNLSNAGRYLVTHGKKTKPQLKAKLAELLIKAQPFLPFVELKGE